MDILCPKQYLEHIVYYKSSHTAYDRKKCMTWSASGFYVTYFVEQKKAFDDNHNTDSSPNNLDSNVDFLLFFLGCVF